MEKSSPTHVGIIRRRKAPVNALETGYLYCVILCVVLCNNFFELKVGFYERGVQISKM
jgi:hypothetical protein